MTTELVNVTTGEIVEYEAPAEFMERAKDMAARLTDVVRQQGLAVDIQGKKYLKLEAWQFLAGMAQLTPRTRDLTEIKDENNRTIGFRVYVELVRNHDALVIGGAFGRCDLNERIARNGAFAAESMATTRATNKAISQKLRFVPVLAGYVGTPAEEMTTDRPVREEIDAILAKPTKPQPPLPKKQVKNDAADTYADDEMDAEFSLPAGAPTPKSGSEMASATHHRLKGSAETGGAKPSAPAGAPSWIDKPMNCGNWPKRTWAWLCEGECDGARATWVSNELDKANTTPGYSTLLKSYLEHAIVQVSKNPPKAK